MRVVKLCAFTLILLALSLPVSAQAPDFVRVQDTISSNGDSFVVSVRGYASARFQTLDSYSGTWEVQCSVDDGTTYDTDDEVNLSLEGSTAAQVQSVTDAVGIWTASVAGCTHIKVISTAGFAASDTVVAVSAVASGGSSGASGGSTGATQDADDASIAAGQTNDNVNSFTMAYDGSVWRRVTFYANDATAAGTTFIPTLPGLVETSAPTRTNGRMAGLSFTAGGAARVIVTDAAGAAVTIATDATHDSAASATGPQDMKVAAAYGALPSAVTAADAVRGAADLQGVTYVRSATDPCSGVAKSYHVVNMSTATTVEIANAVASQSWHICSVNLVAAAAQTIAIGIDDTDGCGSITTGLHGGATAATGWSFAANGGIALGNGEATVMKAATADRYLCVITGQAAQISGTIVYVSAP